jgi:hypothetical protein
MTVNVKPITLKILPIIAIAILALCSAASAASNSNVTLRPAKPTHYLYMPMARVNPPGHMVVGLHEFSYAMPGKLQIQASLLDNIGKTCLAAKYGLARDMAIGGGLAWTIANLDEKRNWHHGVPHYADPRLGLFLTYDIAESKNVGMAVTPHTQIGDHFSLGADFGMRITPVNFWSFLWETGVSVDITDGELYLYGIGGLRIHPPTVPFLFIDVGVGTNEFKMSEFKPGPKVFIDAMVCFITGR